MSLGVVVKSAEGIVLGADSRVTLEATGPGVPHPIIVNFDNATKLLSFGKKHRYVGAVTYGTAVIGLRTAHSYMPEFEIFLADERMLIEQYARKLSQFFLARWTEAQIPPGPNNAMTFIVAGYNADQPYGTAYTVVIPHSPDPVQQHPGPQDFGMTWGGQLHVASRLIHGFDPGLIAFIKNRFHLDDVQTRELSRDLSREFQYKIPFDILPLQDCINLTSFVLRSTITMQNFGVTARGVGGAIEIATITRKSGLLFIQRKKIHGEFGDELECDNRMELNNDSDS